MIGYLDSVAQVRFGVEEPDEQAKVRIPAPHEARSRSGAKVRVAMLEDPRTTQRGVWIMIEHQRRQGCGEHIVFARQKGGQPRHEDLLVRYWQTMRQ